VPETCYIVTCEHGGNNIPAGYAPLFDGYRETLDSHRGYDAGALELAERFAGALGAPLFAVTLSRLLIDCNRSLSSRALFSTATRNLSRQERQEIIERFYIPFRQPVEKNIEEYIRKGRRVLHLSVHTFTPVFNGVQRRGDIGLLYDPVRQGERKLCLDWQHRLRMLLPELAIRRNYPYRGTSDGFVASLRKRYGDEQYTGCELEVNQKHNAGPTDVWHRIVEELVDSFLALSIL